MVDTKSRNLGSEDFLGDKRGHILQIAEKHGARNVRVFGSVARGKVGLDSDIDLLVKWDVGYQRSSCWACKSPMLTSLSVIVRRMGKSILLDPL